MICAANWKMNKTPAEAKTFMSELAREMKPGEAASVVLFPQAFCLQTVLDAARPLNVRVGAQSCDWHKSGAFTGENSPTTLAAMGGSFCLVGHSERRQLFGETDERVARKARAAQDAGLIPVVCVGELAEERQAGLTDSVLARQVEVGLSEVDWQKPIWLAYEPVWAIGTGLVATVEQVRESHRFLSDLLKSRFSASPTLLYGGSVKPENAGDLARVEKVDGFLIGGASLEVPSLLGILRAKS